MGYAIDGTTTVLKCGYKVVGAMFGYDFTYWRGYMKFNITSPPFTLAEIDSVVLRLYCTAKSVNGTVRLRSAGAGTNWGATLVANSTDYNSTSTELEDDVSITSTGSKDFDVDKNNLNLSGYTYFRVSYLNDGGTQSLIQFASQNNGTSANRPLLIVNWTEAATGISHSQGYIF